MKKLTLMLILSTFVASVVHAESAPPAQGKDSQVVYGLSRNSHSTGPKTGLPVMFRSNRCSLPMKPPASPVPMLPFNPAPELHGICILRGNI